MADQIPFNPEPIIVSDEAFAELDQLFHSEQAREREALRSGTERALRRAWEPVSPPVTIETVGEEVMRSNPWTRNAVRAGISQQEFIRLLLEENSRLMEILEKAISLSPPRPIPIGQVHPPALRNPEPWP